MTTPTAAAARTSQPAGPAVDAAGRTVIDPTENVKSLTQAAVQRLDDIANLRERFHHEAEETRRYYEDRLQRLVEQLRLAESDRINAIRAVDVGAVSQAALVATTQANTLAAQVATSAETLRTQVAAAASAATVSLAAALVPIQEAIADLRRAQYEAQGQKTQVIETRGEAADLKPVLDAIAELTRAQTMVRGASAGIDKAWGYVIGFIGVCAAVIGVIISSR